MIEAKTSHSAFTLPEVCVAVVVLAFGVTALCRGMSSLTHVSLLERSRAEELVEAVSRMELQIEQPPSCLDSGVVCRAGPDSFHQVCSDVFRRADSSGVFWSTITVGSVQIKRLVKCF